MKACALAILAVWTCGAQPFPQTPAQLFPQTPAQLDERLQRDLRGLNDQEPIRWVYGPTPAIAQPQRPTGVSVSVAALQHKVPKAAQKSFARARKLSKAGDHMGAAAELEMAVQRDRSFAGAYNALGVEYLQLGGFTEARMALERALELDPDYSNANYSLAVLLLQVGDLAGAEKNVRRTLQVASENAYAHWLLGYLLYLHDATRAEGLQHVQYAARTIKDAKQFLRTAGQ